jgi:hypothetical protein
VDLPDSRLVTLMVWHACGHRDLHPVPAGLSEEVRERIRAKLAKEHCWRCLVGQAWEHLAPWLGPGGKSA